MRWYVGISFDGICCCCCSVLSSIAFISRRVGGIIMWCIYCCILRSVLWVVCKVCDDACLSLIECETRQSSPDTMQEAVSVAPSLLEEFASGSSYDFVQQHVLRNEVGWVK